LLIRVLLGENLALNFLELPAKRAAHLQFA
jgi:hypothetical protein